MLVLLQLKLLVLET